VRNVREVNGIRKPTWRLSK